VTTRKLGINPSLLVAALVAGIVVLPTTPAFAAVFTDGFESGDTSGWTVNAGVTVEGGAPFAPAPEGVLYARLSSTGSSEYIQKSIATQSDLYVAAQVDIGAAPDGLTLIRFLTASNGQLVSLKIDRNLVLSIKNHVSGGGPASSVAITPNAWHELELHATVAGASSLVEVWLDGMQVTSLTSNLSLGTTPVGAVQLGNKGSTTGGFDVGFDAVTFDTSRIGGGGPPTPPATPSGLREISHTSSAATIAWNTVAGATHYGVYRDSVKIGPDITTTSFTDSGLSLSTSYSYTVDAFNGAGRSLPSDPVVVTTSGAGGSNEEVVVMAAGDIACDPADVDFNGGVGTAKKCRQMSTSDLLAGADNVFALGDTQYVCGGGAAYQQSYGPSWGRFKSITWAIPADQEYEVSGGTDCRPGALGYYNYFGNRGGSVTAPPLPGVDQSTIPGVYSFDLPEGCTPGPGGDCIWHVVGLLSVCKQAGGCGTGSPMQSWLDQDLRDNSWAQCTAVMLHLPRFSSKANGNNQINNQMLDLWQTFVAHRVEFVLSGNSHYYERFAPQDALGNANPNGTVQWIVGSGGRGHGGLAAPGSRLPNSQAGTKDVFGVLKLTLRDGSYGWDFLPIAGATFSDTGTRSCV
jgi:hypothetical protein